MEKITDLVLFKKHGEKKNRSGFSLKKKKSWRKMQIWFLSGKHGAFMMGSLAYLKS